jgi:hypothetical protein
MVSLVEVGVEPVLLEVEWRCHWTQLGKFLLAALLFVLLVLVVSTAGGLIVAMFRQLNCVNRNCEERRSMGGDIPRSLGTAQINLYGYP